MYRLIAELLEISDTEEYHIIVDQEINSINVINHPRFIAEGKALGWHQGRTEFGHRALCGRSVLGDARSPSMQRLLNLKVKYRESFPPLAPSVLREDVSARLHLDTDRSYILLVAEALDRQRIP